MQFFIVTIVSQRISKSGYLIIESRLKAQANYQVQLQNRTFWMPSQRETLKSFG